jgi:serine/threonine-protein kinase
VSTRKLGKYEVVERLGRGGMAEVYRAYHSSLDRFVAIKLLHAFLADDPEFKTRFEKEARNIARLKHPNIVQVYDFENDPDTESYFMVMELIDGETLKDVMGKLHDAGQPMSIAEALRITRQSAGALAYAHSQGMIHRDVKPANLMIDQEGRVILTDFGIAKIVTGIQFTASGGMVGTPAYMAPEQGLGEAGDERSDLYSLGVILFHLVTGQLPFEADTPLAIILRHLNDPIPSARALNPQVPLEVDQIIIKLMAKRPEDRYQNANELIAAIEAIERGERPYVDVRDMTPLLPMPAVGRRSDEGETRDLTATSAQSVRIKTQEAQRAMRSAQTDRTLVYAQPRRGIPNWLALLLIIGFIGAGGYALTVGGGGERLLALLISPTPSFTPTATSTETPSATPTQTETPSATASYTNTPTSTSTPTHTHTLTATFTPTYTDTPSATPTPTITLTPSLTPTLTPSATLTLTPTASFTPTATLTPTLTPTITPTATLTSTATLTPSLTPSLTLTPTPSPTITPTLTPTFTPSRTPSPTITLTPSITPTASPDVTQTLIQATLLQEIQTATIAACDFDYVIVAQDPENGFFQQADTAFSMDITVRNVGTCVWERNTALTFVTGGGENFDAEPRIFIRERVNVGEATTITLLGRAPSNNGVSSGLWELRTPGQLLIGAPLTISVNVFGGR